MAGGQVGSQGSGPSNGTEGFQLARQDCGTMSYQLGEWPDPRSKGEMMKTTVIELLHFGLFQFPVENLPVKRSADFSKVKIGIGLARDSSPWMHNVTGSSYLAWRQEGRGTGCRMW